MMKEEIGQMLLGESSALDLSDTQWAEAMLSDGELKLLKGNFTEALEKFAAAETIAPLCADIYVREALSLMEYGAEEKKTKALSLACKKFKTAAHLKPDSLEVWHAWAGALTMLAKETNQLELFYSAKEKIEQALTLSSDQNETLIAELHWDSAIIWKGIAYHSEEAVDLQCALQAFEKASSIARHLSSEFWVDYGTTLIDLFGKMRDLKLLMRAISCLKCAVSKDESSFEGWKTLASTLSLFYEQTHDEDHFGQANECYGTATRLGPQDTELWLEWARFLCDSAHRTQDIKRLRAALEKCHMASIRDSKHPIVLATWGECLALLGQLSERVDLLHEAQNKISEALEISEEDPEVWCSYGIYLVCSGAYFADVDLYYQAIEKFQAGLTIDRSFSRLWVALATTYALVGGLENNVETLEKSLKFFEKALSLETTSTTIFQYALSFARLGEQLHSQVCLERAIIHFEWALSMQKNALYVHPDWLFHYASTLDLIGDFHDEEKYYTRAIEIFTHVLMIDPDFPRLHHRIAQVFCHLGELTSEVDHFYRAIHHLRLALKAEEEDDQMILDWGIVLVSIAQHGSSLPDVDQLYREAEHKMTLSAKLGNLQAFYHLCGLYSILGDQEKSFHFLMKAAENKALPPLEEILNDEWLDNLRSSSQFREFMARIESRQNYLEEC